ncbi:MAG: cysteine--tRNA ligase [Anaerolineales bacterium]
MRLYNTLSKKIETFKPRGDQVKIYVCGITPYDTTHLGHAFTYTSADILIRYLESQGFIVRYAQNVTDIDDDILRKAREVGDDWLEVGNRWTSHFIQDMQALNVRPPDYYPRATDAIPEIVAWVGKLLESGVAYESGGNVYYSVNAWPDFGELCGIPRAKMLPIANERGNHPDDPHKRDPLDFVLWQAQAPGEPAWDSPWGPGRPGWHIECSTLSNKFLGNQVDIHSGGADLCFPHHECEIAQVEPVTGEKPFVRFWMHAAMVYYEGEKMSKSLGNLVWVRELLEVYTPDALRLYLGRHHYREPWSYSERELKASAADAERITEAIQLEGGQGTALDAEGWERDFHDALEDDLDTPGAVEVMLALAEEILEAGEQGRDVAMAQKELRAMGKVFGMRIDKGVEQRVLAGWGEHLGRFLD